MRPGARTPEELETLFEDAFVVRDGDAVAQLFEDGALLVLSGSPAQARGRGEIARVATHMCAHDLTYLADAGRVLQARSTALVVARHGISVVRRGEDGAWRYAISLLALENNQPEQEPT